MIKVATRYGYIPLMLLGINGLAVWLVTQGTHKIWLLALLAVAVGLSFAAERLIPYDDVWNRDLEGDSLRDALHAFVNESLALVSVAAVPVLTVLIPGAGWWPNGWPFVLQLLGAIIVADFGITTVHLASHKIGVLWRFHAVHHSVKRFYGFNGFMKHPLHQTLETSVGVAPLLLLGMPLGVATALAFCVAVQLLLQHSNADYRVGPLRSILALNEGHRFHHLKWAGIGDVNFGLFTLVWDHLYRTYSYDASRVFTTDDLGMAAHPDYPSAYLPQMAYPFRPEGSCAPEEITFPPEHMESSTAQDR
ncbi:sterol desaturase family protein [Mycolicibacterium farcinogenes]|uniref:Sterol desaturase family protein n=1 Tax=Mycolicibacterium farcinogenes TaxID=1802 RepID=A0ACD1FQW3_MYCFR|nr:sterol desaturase family protein [Mycolicibacterium farcinogenes]QZH69441.1 sterol desaturase family protein [Mycolicibacterium farcinogenes]